MGLGGLLGSISAARTRANWNALPEWEQHRQMFTGEAHGTWVVALPLWVFTRFTKRGRAVRAAHLAAYEEGYRRDHPLGVRPGLPGEHRVAEGFAPAPNPYSLRPPKG